MCQEVQNVDKKVAAVTHYANSTNFCNKDEVIIVKILNMCVS